ncbi:SH3 domain-containing protein 19-like isoform X2 [Acipenser ruthenus]|uniref:SH3 domain-containing protein 19-like isoform X2 n=1 Tax=Acipenser ruthenus TaxID=7906 RepID=UPI0027428CAE|nr:SH3 domain-containing protein 19-like isoform X2 [Acipenser ruthenus]
MAEAWLEEDELRDFREPENRRNRRGHMNPATDRSERNKPDQHLPSQGPLSSIRAAIKSSTRVNSPSEQQRDRRRPEIRILAVEPLGPGTWFPGGPGGCASGSAPLGFPPAHSQGLWGDSIPASAQPPPSYDQVIREITHEQVSTTTTNAPPRPSAVTISTQTDCDDAAESSASGSDVTSQAAQSESVPAAVRRPPKPPRPSVLPLTIKPASLLISRESPLISIEPQLVPSEHLLVPESSSVPSECPVVHTNAVSQPLIISTEPLIVPSEPLLVPVSSVVPSKCPVVHTNTVSQPLFVSTESSAVPTESPVVPVEPVLVVEPAAKEGVIIRRPVPRPRLMTSLKPQVKEAQIETLVELKKEDDDENSKVLPNSIEQSTATYLQELLECFYPEEQSDTDSMNTYGNQRNIRAKIQAFESQTSTDINDGELSKRPEIPLRTLAQKPPVAACRPSLAPKPANRGSGELDTLTESKPDLAIKDGPVFVLPKLQGTQVPFGGKPEPPKKPVSNFMIEINNRNASGDKSRSSIINKLQNEKKKTPVPVPRPKLTKINASLENTDLIEQAVVPAPRPSVFQRAKAIGSTGEAPEVSHPTPPLQLANSGLDFNIFNNQTTPAVVSTPRPSISERAKAFGAPDEKPEVSHPTPPLQLVNSGLDFNSFNNQTTPAMVSTPRPSISERAKAFGAPDEKPEVSRPTPPLQLATSGLDFNNFNNQITPALISWNSAENKSSEDITDLYFSKPETTNNVPNRQSMQRKPTVIRTGKPPSRSPNGEDCQAPPPLPAYGPVGGFTGAKPKKPTIASRAAELESGISGEGGSSLARPLMPSRPREAKVLPIRPPPAKGGPKRPPPPKVLTQSPSLCHSSSVAGLHSAGSKRPQSMVLPKKGPVLPSRPGPGHPLYNNYTLAVPHGIAQCDYMSRTPGELSFQKNEVLVLLQQIDSNSYECQGGDEKGKVLQSRMKIITPLNADTGNMGPLKKSFSFGRLDGDGSGLRGRVLHDFTAEHSDELMLRGGDTVTQLEKLDAACYRGTCRGRSGIFPVDFIEVEVDVPAATNGKKASPSPASISGPRCVARFDFEGEQADELTFFEGDVIKLKELVGEEWARGEMNGQTGIFPLNFVEIVEGLIPPSKQQLGQNKLPISEINQNSFGEIKRTPHFGTSCKAKPEVARSGQWCEALYDFAGQTNEDLSFLKGDRILITEKVDSEWYRGRLNGNEGIFPAIFVEGPTEGAVGANPQLGGSTTGKAKALFDFVSESEEELSFKTGDVITALESIDAEWFCGELHGKCGLFPKNYVQVLQEP